MNVMESSTLFSRSERVYNGPMRYCESYFSFYDHSARPDRQRVRELIEKWYADFPDEGKRDLSGRMRSKVESQFQGAFFELFLHAILLTTGQRVQIHRQVRKGKAPDFFATQPDGSSLVLEARLATETSDKERGPSKIVSQVLDAFNSVENRRFWLEVQVVGRSMTTPATSDWKRDLKKWIERPEQRAAVQTPPPLRLKHETMVVTIRALSPRRLKDGESATNSIGVPLAGSEGEMVTTWQLIQAAFLDKKKYGPQRHPYLIAINGTGYNCDLDEFERALYGPNGLWGPSREPAHRHVSGVLGVVQLVPSRIGVAEACLFHNPFAANEYSGSLCALPQVNRIGDQIQRTKGLSARELLGLPDGWPYAKDDT
jgi:hypothetical protein